MTDEFLEDNPRIGDIGERSVRALLADIEKLLELILIEQKKITSIDTNISIKSSPELLK